MLFLDTIARAFGYRKQAVGELDIVRHYAAEPMEWGDSEVLKTYTANEWVYGSVGVTAQEVSSIRLKLMKKTGKGKNMKVEEVTDHPALTLLSAPNPVHSSGELRETSQIQQELLGNAYWLINRYMRSGLPAELWPLDPSRVRLKARGNGTVEYYEYQSAAGLQRYSQEDIVHFRHPNPTHLHYGASPTRAAAISIDSDMQAAKWNLRFFFNNGRPDFVLFIKKITKDAKERFKSMWRQEYGGTDNAHKVAVVDAMEESPMIHEFDRSQKDMDFVEQGKALRDKIIATYRVPKSLMGLAEEVNRASMEASIYIFARYTVSPRIKRFCEKLTIDFLSQFPDAKDMYFTFDDPVPENEEMHLKRIDSGLSGGWMTPNEARASQGLPPLPGGDVLLVPFNKVPLEGAVPLPQKALMSPVRKTLQRAQIKTAYLEKHAKYEARFVRTMRKLFSRQEGRAMQVLTETKAMKAVDPDSLLDSGREIPEFILDTTALYEALIQEGGTNAAALVGVGEFAFDDPNVRTAIAEMTITFAREVNDTTIQALKAALTEGIAAGEGIPDLKKRVQQVFIDANTVRANTIARTETTKAMNQGAVLGYGQLGLEEMEWLSTEDGRTRPAHAAADGQLAKVGDAFSVGGENLRFPADAAGSPENVCNCRCTVIPHLP